MQLLQDSLPEDPLLHLLGALPRPRLNVARLGHLLRVVRDHHLPEVDHDLHLLAAVAEDPQAVVRRDLWPRRDPQPKSQS